MNEALTTAIATKRLSSATRVAENSLVKVEDDGGRLRLRFSWGGKRYAMAIGLLNSAVNRRVAQQKATQIELDIGSGNFDPTLKKYKPPKSNKKAAETQVTGMFRKFMEAQIKVKGLEQGSLYRYDALLKHLEKFFKCKDAEAVNQTEAQAFVEYLRSKVSERSVKDYVILVQSCWVWAIALIFLRG